MIGLLVGMGCGGDGDATDAPSVTDTDTDTDTDADADADTDTDTDTDADTHSSATAHSAAPTADSGPAGVFTLSSPDLRSSAGDPLAGRCDWVLPDPFSCDGPNPEVAWTDPPAGTVAFALILDDPDAGDFPHWAIYDVPATETGLARAISGRDVAPHVLPPGAVELRNGAGFLGYYGSCPPRPHVYRWRVWALDQVITPSRATFGALEAEAAAHSLGEASLCHIYGP